MKTLYSLAQVWPLVQTMARFTKSQMKAAVVAVYFFVHSFFSVVAIYFYRCDPKIRWCTVEPVLRTISSLEGMARHCTRQMQITLRDPENVIRVLYACQLYVRNVGGLLRSEFSTLIWKERNQVQGSSGFIWNGTPFGGAAVIIHPIRPLQEAQQQPAEPSEAEL